MPFWAWLPAPLVMYDSVPLGGTLASGGGQELPAVFGVVVQVSVALRVRRRSGFSS